MKTRNFDKEIDESIRRQFPKRFKDNVRNENIVRIDAIDSNCEYYKHRFYFEKKKMKRESTETLTGWYMFVYKEDEEKYNKFINSVNGKTRFYLERPKIKSI